MTLVTLSAEGADGRADAVIDLDAGARLRRLTVTTRAVTAAATGATGATEAGQTTAEILAPVPDDADPTSSGWGSYPMAPWAGRIRHGRFAHDGAVVALGRNHRDGHGDGGGPISPPLPPDRSTGGSVHVADEPLAHAIHGTVFARPWRIDDQTDDSLSVSCALSGDEPLTLSWPFAGTARQTIALRPDGIDLTIEVELNDETVPVVVGWHPWFAKPDRLDVSLDAMYEVDDIALPTGQLIEPTPGPWDACFVSTEPASLHYDRAAASVVTVTSDCDHLVVYDKPAHATCVEPQSGPPDAVNLREVPAGRGLGSFEVAGPGRPVRHTMSIDWQHPPIRSPR